MGDMPLELSVLWARVSRLRDMPRRHEGLLCDALHQPGALLLTRLDELRADRADWLAWIEARGRRNDMRGLGRARRELRRVTLDILLLEVGV